MSGVVNIQYPVNFSFIAALSLPLSKLEVAFCLFVYYLLLPNFPLLLLPSDTVIVK